MIGRFRSAKLGFLDSSPRRLRRLYGLGTLLLALGGGSAWAQNEPPAKAGFPLTLSGKGSPAYSTPVVADLGLSKGVKSIVFGTAQGDLHVICLNNGGLCTGPASGQWGEATGFPVHVGTTIASSPAVGDLDGDGAPEIVVGHGNVNDVGIGGVKAYRRDGSVLWALVTQDLSGDGQPDPVVGGIAIGDINGDGRNDVVFGGLDQFIYAVQGATGANLPGSWPIFIRDTIFSTPALYDIDGDGILDVIVGVDAHAEGGPFQTPDGGCLHVLRFDTSQPHVLWPNPSVPSGNPADWPPPTEIAGWKQCVDQVIGSSPVVGDIDGDGQVEIIHGTGHFYPGRQHRIYAWHRNGSPVAGWDGVPGGVLDHESIETGGLALADLNGDGILDVVATDWVGGGPFQVYGFNGPNGVQIFKSLPKDLFNANLSAGPPVIAHVLGAGSDPQILVPTNGSVAVFSKTGVLLTNDGSHPSNLDFYNDTGLSGTAAVDFENDGVAIEVVSITGSPPSTGVDTKIKVWNPTTALVTTPPWPFFHDNERRTGVYRGVCSVRPLPSPVGFSTVTPCRVVDTSNPSGAYGGPNLSASALRDFTLAGQCGVPVDARAVSLNLTVTNGSHLGHIRVAPGCVPPDNLKSLPFLINQSRANNVVLALDRKGAITTQAVITSGGNVRLIIDVNGYFR